MPTVSELKDFNWKEVSVLVVNGGEALELLEAFGEKSSSVKDGDDEKILEALQEVKQLQEINWLVMTRGARGVLARVKLQDQDQRKLFSIPPAKPKKVVDTTGAGDTFAGNLVAGLMREVDSKKFPTEEQVKKALGWAVQAAAMAVEKEGAMESIPSREEVEKRLEESK